MNSMQTRLTSVLIAAAAFGLAACGGAPKSGAPASSPAGGPAMAEEAKASGGDYGASPAAPAQAKGEGSFGGAQSAPAPAAGMRGSSDAVMKEKEAGPSPRPGLGTEWGESRFSKVSTAPFVRAESERPFAIATLFYNDRAGIQAMVDQWGGTPTSQTFVPVWQGYLDVALKGEGGEFLSGMSANGRNYVAGEAGRRYTIVVRNHSPGRIEVLATVDGLDVIDGKAGAFSKRGYLVEPQGTLEIEGFRQSESHVAAFRFGAVTNSYVERKTGDARNVGVIGVAFFYEQGDSPNNWSAAGDALRRQQANPFPQQYATPP
jgi:hypothetical protein